jgi:hypothetical protein
MPPVIITKVIPIANSPITEVCNNTVSPLLMLRKAGLVNENATISRQSVRIADSLWIDEPFGKKRSRRGSAGAVMVTVFLLNQTRVWFLII